MLFTILLFFFLILIFFGLEIFYALAISSTIFIVINLGLDNLIIVPQRMVASLGGNVLLSIPLFILAGQFMNAGGITEVLVKFAKALVGHIPGGLSYVAIITNVIMSGVSGSSLADASATGIILIPSMKKDGYPSPYAAAVIGAGAIIGPIIPPSIIMIIYGSQAEVSIARLFIGGVIPGLFMGFFAFLVCLYKAKKYRYPKSLKVNFIGILKAFKDSFLVLMMPVVILGCLVTGIVSAAETAVIAVTYAFLLGTFVYRKLRIKDIPELLFEVGRLTSVIMIIVASSGIYSYIIADQRAGYYIMNLLLSVGNDTVILLLILFFLLILGMFISPIPAIIILTPIFLPLIHNFGIDPVFFGVFLVITLMIGALTPPVGATLYLVAGLSEDSIYEVTKELLPFICIYILLVIIIIFIPSLVTFLPKYLMG